MTRARDGIGGQTDGQRCQLTVGHRQHPHIGIWQLGVLRRGSARQTGPDEGHRGLRAGVRARHHRLDAEHTRLVKQPPQRLADPTRTQNVERFDGDLVDYQL